MRKKAVDREATRKRRVGIEKVASRFATLRPAAEILRKVSAVQTCFTQVDHATEVGGFPIERFSLVHGPSAGGKTKLTLGLIGSFLSRGHFAFHVDAERTTSIDFAELMMGVELARSPRFFASRPATYEETVRQVREFAKGVLAAREAKEVPEDTSAIIVVDSIKKLVPEGILAKILGDAKTKGIDGVGGRAAQLKAAMNAAWLDELVPLLEDTRTTMVAIARETEDPDADPWAKKAGRDFKVGGGKALYYDASLVMRVELDRFVAEKVSKEEYDEGKRGKVYGERHRVTVRKTKVSGKEEREAVAFFHSSNGVLVPEGFDRARDLVDHGSRLGIVKRSGSWLQWGRNRWQGDNAAVKKLSSSPDLMSGLEAAVREAFGGKAPPAHDADGVVVE